MQGGQNRTDEREGSKNRGYEHGSAKWGTDFEPTHRRVSRQFSQRSILKEVMTDLEIHLEIILFYFSDSSKPALLKSPES